MHGKIQTFKQHADTDTYRRQIIYTIHAHFFKHRIKIDVIHIGQSLNYFIRVISPIEVFYSNFSGVKYQKTWKNDSMQ